MGLPRLNKECVLQVLHAQQQQRQRMKALSRFQGGTCAVLVATDVAARGLHISAVDMVVQYQLPPTADTYIHRAGRTARAGAEGVCVSVVVPQESERFSRLHTALGQKVPQQFPVDVTVLRDLRSRARLAKRIDDIERVNSKASADFNWMQRQSAAIGEFCYAGPKCVCAHCMVIRLPPCYCARSLPGLYHLISRTGLFSVAA